jgi:hypothetical protein
MNRATRTTSGIIGVYAGLLGAVHGVYEILQGNAAPTRYLINAIGPPCQVELASHACFPALTLLPNFLISGILSVIIGLVIIFRSLAFVERDNGGLILILLSLLLLPIGGGFLPPLYGIIAGAAGTKIHSSFSWWLINIPTGITRNLGALWPWALTVYFAWALLELLLGYLFNDIMMQVSAPILSLTLLLLLLSVFAALAHDVMRRSSHQEEN